MLLPELSCVCIPSFRSVAPRVCIAKVPFLAFFCHLGIHFSGFVSPGFKLGQPIIMSSIREINPQVWPE